LKNNFENPLFLSLEPQSQSIEDRIRQKTHGGFCGGPSRRNIILGVCVLTAQDASDVVVYVLGAAAHANITELIIASTKQPDWPIYFVDLGCGVRFLMLSSAMGFKSHGK
jgi:hypothetical protein